MADDGDTATEILPTIAPTAEPQSLIGRTLGRFVVLERLGRGGSGEVFRAEQAQLGRSAVVKTLRREVALVPNRVERFLREAKLASRLDHPYAAHVYAFGAEPDGILWIAMEHVRGATLDELVARRGPTPPAIFGPLFGRLCEVIHTAHELGIIHRDIKGSNVMVIERAGQLLPKLIDFGIAKGIDDHVLPAGDDTHDSELTGHGSTLGSPHYMSPEQWASPAEVDARADVYALGVLAYRCLSGKLPFHDVQRPNLSEAHLSRPPPALPTTLPARITEVVMRALAKRPDARWPSALALGDAMQRAVGGVAPEAVPLFDPVTRDAWIRGGPQPIADAVAHLASATTTVEADAALGELVAITCRWLAVIALSHLGTPGAHARHGRPDIVSDLGRPGSASDVSSELRERARAVVGRDDGAPWLQLARAAAAATTPLAGLDVALARCDSLASLADRLDDRSRERTLTALAADMASASDALRLLDPLLAYQLVVGRSGAAESWQGTRRRDRERAVVWGEPLADGEVALLDGVGRVAVRLSPLIQIISPLPSSEPELFLLWRSGRGAARLVAAPWGFERDDDAVGQRLALLTTEDTDTQADAGDDRSPYPGLAAYGVADADRFVGREREVEALANRLIRAPLIAVLGPSGAGKSSFIHAGVMPRLAEHYEIITMRPGRHPLHALAALPPIGIDTEDSAGLVAKLRALGERAPRGLVIVIDQLEELVTLCSDPDERHRFAETLAAAASDSTAPVRVVVTLRDDFATVIESEDAFRGRFEVFVLAAPAPEALRRIVIEPARRASVTVDAHVVDDMVAEVVGRPASLPLLSFTASQLWQTRDRTARRITHEAYLALGGVAGALSTYADEVYGSLARRDQEVVRDLFGRLVATDGTRIPAPRAELEELPGAHGVLAHLIDARLLVVREADGVDIIEIVHECLAERWQRLARWRSEDAADRALLDDVHAAARRWQDAKQRPDLLWRGPALAELRRLVGRTAALTDIERAFAQASDRAERRSRWIRRSLVVAVMVSLGAVAIVMAYLGLAANRSRSAAELSANAARDAAKLAEDRLTQSVIAQGRRELNDGRALEALAYFGEAMRRNADTPGLRFMIAIASRAWPYERVVDRGAKYLSSATAPDGIAAGDSTGRIHFWTRDAEPAGELATELGELSSLRWRGNRMLALGRLGIALIDPARREIVARLATKSPPLSVQLGPGPDEVSSIEHDAITVYGSDGKVRRSVAIDTSQGDSEPVWSPDAHHVFLSIVETTQMIDLVAMKITILEHKTRGGPYASATGNAIGYVDQDRVVHILDSEGKPLRTIHPSIRPDVVIISASGDRIGAVADHSITVYDASGKELRTVALDAEQGLIIIDGDEMWTGGATGVIRHYHEDTLVASQPSAVTEIEEMKLAGGTLIAISSDSNLIMVRSDAHQLVDDVRPCKYTSFSPVGTTISYMCESGDQLVYVGNHFIGSQKDPALGFAAIDPISDRGATSGRHLAVYDPKGVQLATSDEHTGAIDFEDSDHLLVANVPLGSTAVTGNQGIWRWGFAKNQWTHVADVFKASALAVGAGGVLVGTEDHKVVLLSGGAVVHTTDLGDGVDFLLPSRDRRYVAAQLGAGGTVILDGTTGEINRRLEPGDSINIAAMLDGPGDLVIRATRGTLTIWDRATGDDLVFNLDLLKSSVTAAFAPDGRLELAGKRAALLAIPRETRPRAAIIHDIECKVPLRVAGGRLEPSTADCSRSR